MRVSSSLEAGTVRHLHHLLVDQVAELCLAVD